MSLLKPNKISGFERFIGDVPAFFLFMVGAVAFLGGIVNAIPESGADHFALKDVLDTSEPEFLLIAGPLAAIVGLISMRRLDYVDAQEFIQRRAQSGNE